MTRRRSMFLHAAYALLLGLAAASCHGGEERSAETPRSTSAMGQAPDFTLRTIGCASFRVADHLGKEAIVLSFFATWCEECFVELPHLQQVYDAHAKDGLLFVGVSMDGPESAADVGPFIRRHGLTMPVVIDEETRAVSLYNPRRSAPFMVLIDRQGHIVKVREGYVPGEADQITEEIRRILTPS